MYAEFLRHKHIIAAQK